MKLVDLLEAFDEISPRTSNTSDVLNRMRSRDQAKKRLGHGIEGTVMHINKDREPGTVARFSSTAVSGNGSPSDRHQDGYLYYAQVVKALQDDGDTNPYFPRIEHTKQYGADKEGDHLVRIKLELLHPFKEMGGHPEQAVAQYKRMFTLPLEPQTPDDSDSIYAQYVLQQMLSNVAMLLRGGVGGKLKTVKDPDLKAAIEVIRQVIEDTGKGEDLHGGNVMWRYTSTGPQLVLVDPIA